jgi:AcrR family transcriptional regulator
MTNQKIDTKDLIIDETIKLIKEKKDADKISMRSIAKNADIAVSVINYHFQTKANLIDKAVQTYVKDVIKNSNQRHSAMELTPEQRIRSGINAAANFLAENPGISRVSILNGLKDGHIGDNSDQMYRSILSQLKSYFNDNYDEITFKILAQQ